MNHITKLRYRAAAEAAAEAAKDLLFPARCPVCADAIPFEARMRRLRRRYELISGSGQRNRIEPLRAASGHACIAHHGAALRNSYEALICRECLSSFSYIHPPFCSKCGKQLSALSSTEFPQLCTDCGKKERQFISCRCVATYEEVEQEILMGIKYKGRKADIELLGLLAVDVLGDWIRSVRPECIVPVPVHEKRRRTRGYNQAGIFAEDIGRRMGIPCCEDALKRSRNTGALKELTAQERLFSLQNAFLPGRALEQGKLQGRRVLLVDDIYTTGATMEACTETLLEGGVREVYGLCFCAGRDAAKVLYN